MFAKIRELIRNPLAVILVLQFVVFHIWLLSNVLLTDGDWGFYVHEALTSIRLNYFSLWLPDSDFGRVLIDVGQAPTYALYGFLAAYFNLDFAASERIVHMSVIVIGAPISMYLLLKDLVKSRLAIFVGAIVYCYNTYSLTLSTGHLTLAAAFALVPLAVFCYKRCLERRGLKWALLSGLVCAVVTAYEPRAAYILIGVLALQTIFHLFNTRSLTPTIMALSRQLIYPLIAFIFFILLNFYWIYGLMHTSGVSDTGVLNRGLFGNGFFNISYALTLHHPFWNGEKPIPFLVQSIPVYFWLVPVFAFAGLYFNRRNRNVFLFGAIALLGIFLSKQVDAPFTSIYNLLFTHLPGFNAFREASKFYSLIALGYAVLIAYLVDWSRTKKSGRIDNAIRISAPILIIIIFLVNAVPVASGKIATLFVARQMPNDYHILNTKLESEKDYSRTLWIPVDPRWASFSQVHPKVNLIGLYYSKWNKLSGIDDDSNLPADDKLISLLHQSYTESIIRSGAIKYVIVPMRDELNDDDFFVHYGNVRERYINELDQLSFLEKVDIGTKDVAVYVVKNYDPYFSASTDVLNVDNTEGLSSIYAFTQSYFKKRYDFVINESSIAAQKVSRLFANMQSKNISNKGINYAGDSSESVIVKDEGYRQITYRAQGDSVIADATDLHDIISIYSTESLPLRNTKRVAFKTDAKKDYYVATDHNIKRIAPNSNGNLGYASSPVTFYENDKVNLIDNGSFEKGLWQKDVRDCNKYDEAGGVSMSVDSSTSTKDKKSLRLQAISHNACTVKSNIAVRGQASYLLTFDYKESGGRELGYKLTFNDGANTVIEKKIIAQNNSWAPFATVFSAPTGASKVSVTLIGYQDDRGSAVGITNFDGVSMAGMNRLQKIESPTPSLLRSKLTSSDKVELPFAAPEPSNGVNLVKNGSLEAGLWQTKIGDCNSYDNKPQISMALSNESSEGKRSIELHAKRHTACTGPNNVDVEENTKYLLSFDYQSPTSASAGVNVGFDDPLRTANTYQSTAKNKAWNKYEKVINAPTGAESLKLSLYGYSDDENRGDMVIRYDNVSLYKLPANIDQYYSVGKVPPLLQEPKSIDFTINSTTKRIVKINSASTSFFLKMAETYNPGWQLSVIDAAGLTINVIPDRSHFKLNEFENGWYIDIQSVCSHRGACVENDDGTYNLQLIAKFAPQEKLIIGVLISGSVLLIGLVYLLSTLYRKDSVKLTKPIHSRKRLYYRAINSPDIQTLRKKTKVR